jgi:hypothetical protein
VLRHIAPPRRSRRTRRPESRTPAARSVNREREHRCAVRDHDSDRPPVGNDDTPKSSSREASRAAPARRCKPCQPDLEAVTSDVRIRPACVAGDRRYDTEDGLSWRDRDESEIVFERLFSPEYERNLLADRRGLVGGRDRDPELRSCRRADDERAEADREYGLHAFSTTERRDPVHGAEARGDRAERPRLPVSAPAGRRSGRTRGRARGGVRRARERRTMRARRASPGRGSRSRGATLRPPR